MLASVCIPSIRLILLCSGYYHLKNHNSVFLSVGLFMFNFCLCKGMRVLVAMLFMEWLSHDHDNILV